MRQKERQLQRIFKIHQQKKKKPFESPIFAMFITFPGNLDVKDVFFSLGVTRQINTYKANFQSEIFDHTIIDETKRLRKDLCSQVFIENSSTNPAAEELKIKMRKNLKEDLNVSTINN